MKIDKWVKEHKDWGKDFLLISDLRGIIVERPEGRKKFPYREYDWTDWEEYFFYHNNVKRRFNFGCDKLFQKLYDGCFDCQSEIRQWQLYVDKYHNGLQTKILELADTLNRHVGNLKYTGIWCSLIENNKVCIEIMKDRSNDRIQKDKRIKKIQKVLKNGKEVLKNGKKL